MIVDEENKNHNNNQGNLKEISVEDETIISLENVRLKMTPYISTCSPHNNFSVDNNDLQSCVGDVQAVVSVSDLGQYLRSCEL